MISLSLKIKIGLFFKVFASLMPSQTLCKYSKSHLRSSRSFPSPAVLTINPIESGTFKEAILSLSLSLSLPSNLLEIPAAFGLLGIKTKYLPARLILVVRAAPLLPRSSFST